MRYSDLLTLLAPEIVVLLAALAILTVDLLFLRDVSGRARRLLCGLMACGGSFMAGGCALAIVPEANWLNGMLVLHPMTGVVKAALLALAAAAALLSVGFGFTRHVGEFFAVLLIATIGLMLLVSSENLLMIFLSLELSSICLYVLAAFSADARSSEAALKYFLFGGMAAAFTLFGMSLVYGLTGSVNLGEIARALAGGGTAAGQAKLDPLLITALVMTLAGFGFKVAVAPFHLWAPDVYEAAPVPSAALIASASKVGGFFVLAKVLMVGFPNAAGSAALFSPQAGWIAALGAIAAVSMILGNLAALVQTSVRRLLAYSAIAHGGYLLLGVMAPGSMGLKSVVYYAVTYACATLGAFGVLALVQNSTGRDDFSALSGLHQRSPVTAACLAVFILSLAGIPPLAGFFGKFYVFAAALKQGPTPLSLLWLVALAVGASAVSLYYYLQILKQVYVRPADPALPPLQPPLETLLTITVAGAAVLLLGLFPQWLLAGLQLTK